MAFRGFSISAGESWRSAHDSQIRVIMIIIMRLLESDCCYDLTVRVKELLVLEGFFHQCSWTSLHVLFGARHPRDGEGSGGVRLLLV